MDHMESIPNTMLNINDQCVYTFNFDIEHDLLLLELEHNMHRATFYQDARMDEALSNWKIIKGVSSKYVDRIIKFFEIDAKPRFYVLEPNSVLPEHVDYNTECSINFVIGDDQPAPVCFGEKKYLYRNAVLNTKIPHGVINGNKERVILKLSIFDLTYTQVCDKISNILLTKKWS